MLDADAADAAFSPRHDVTTTTSLPPFLPLYAATLRALDAMLR